MTKIKRWVIGLLLAAALVIGASAVPAASGHRSAATKRAESRQDARLTHTMARDRKKLAKDEAADTKLSGLRASTLSEDPEEAQDEETEQADEGELNEDEQDENEETGEEDEQEEGEEGEEGTEDGADE